MFRNLVIGSSIFAGCIGWGYYLKSGQDIRYTNPIRADGKVAIVTGANSGIGLETARELARRGAKVYMACRDLEKCNKAREDIITDSNNDAVYCRECDLSSQLSIKQFVKRFQQEEKQLHILVNNAGIMSCPKAMTKEGIELQLGVNFIGRFLLSILLLDLLKSSKPSRIINVTNCTYAGGDINLTDFNLNNNYDPGVAYTQSQLANILFTRELSKKLSTTGVTVNAVHPGAADTNIKRYIEGAPDDTAYQVSDFFTFITKPLLLTPRAAADRIIHLALEPALNDTSGAYFHEYRILEPPNKAKDDSVATWLWKVSEKWTNLSHEK